MTSNAWAGVSAGIWRVTMADCAVLAALEGTNPETLSEDYVKENDTVMAKMPPGDYVLRFHGSQNRFAEITKNDPGFPVPDGLSIMAVLEPSQKREKKK